MLTDVQIVTYNALSTFAWGLLTVILMLTLQRSHEYVARVVSLVHAVVALIVCSYALYDGHPHADFCTQARDWELYAIMVTFGYFLMDAIGMCLSNFFDILFMLHHAISLVGFALPMVVRSNAYEVVVVIMILEFSNPVMHLHWLAVEDSVKQGVPPGTSPKLWHVFLRRTFYLHFAIGRFIFGPWSLYEVSTHSCCYWLHAFIGLCFLVFSTTFFVELMLKVKRKESWR